jgi:alkanesulfonate monooxygenase SsuD/methylene tetrahydromethanopterin reductase-like flavin-dependent oxidoreductase (luciferase family)
MWFYDHLYAPGLPGLASLEGWTLATYVLAATTRLRAGHLVLCNNFRHPAVLAKMVSTLDLCSGGRLEVGLGSGSVEEEHHRAGLQWGTGAERAQRLEEAIELLCAMITVGEGETDPTPTTFTGRHYSVTDLPNLPGPFQRPRPPLHIGGIGHKRTLPLVARYADVWNVPTYGLGRWREHQEVLEGICADIGRDPSSIRRSHQAVLVLAPDDRSVAEAQSIAERRFGGPTWGLHEGGYIGTPTQVVDRIGQVADEGVSFFVFFTHDRADPRTLELLAAEVLPALR